MSAAPSTSTPSTLGRRRHLVVGATAGVLGAAAWYTAANDPSAAGSRFPVCIFHRVTGLWCPGCGLTRGTHALLTGHPIEALGFNVFTPMVAVLVVVMWTSWAVHQYAPSRPVWRPSASIVNTAAALLVAYGVLRNIPASPFRSLAP
jgi:hypothetical protein